MKNCANALREEMKEWIKFTVVVFVTAILFPHFDSMDIAGSMASACMLLIVTFFILKMIIRFQEKSK